MSPNLLVKLLHLTVRVPGVYRLLAFVTARRVVVRGSSMYPTLSPGEYVLFDRLAYWLRPPSRGDIVLASHPKRPRHRLVKRVAAIPRDRVALHDRRCWVNGKPYGEPPLLVGPPPEEPQASILGEEEYLLLGDAPDLSTDARDFGPVSREQIHARAWLVYWPLHRWRVVPQPETVATAADP